MGFGSLLSDFNNTDEQGDFGEFKVKNKILRLGEKLGYFYLVRDVYIETKYFVQQIDHILINSNGIFVIETKAVSGTVAGHADEECWVSRIYGNYTPFYNPIMQNKKHIEALRDLLGNEYMYHSVIVFSENNKPNSLPDNVVNIRELQDYILSFDCEPKLDQGVIDYLKSRIEELLKDRVTLKRKHHEQLKFKKKYR